MIFPIRSSAEQKLYYGDGSGFGVDQTTLIINQRDTTGNLKLQFGNTLNESILWDNTNLYFTVSDNISLGGNQILDFRMENVSSAPTCDGTKKGRLYHNTANTFSYMCDGSAWRRIDIWTQSGTDVYYNSGNVGIGTASPSGNLSVSQTAAATGVLKGIIYTGAVNTNQTLSTEIPALTLTTAGRQWATGALTTQREVLITQPTYSFVGASIITNAATVGIAGAPIKSTNATITNTHGILVQAGAVSTATNSYGTTINAQTGATNNYAAAFLGGNVGIGTTSPLSKLHIAETASTFPRSITSDQYSADAVPSASSLRKSRNATVGDHTIVQSGDGISNFTSWGSDGTNFIAATTIRSSVDGTPGTNDMPGRIEFYTTPDGASVVLERMRIDNAGNVGIGTASPSGNLSVSQTAAATGVLKGIVYTGAVNTNQTLSTEIPALTLTTAGRQWATGALATQREVLITQPTYSFVGASIITDAATVGISGAPIKSTNATITNTHGLLVQAGAVSTATNSYGTTINAQTGATNNYAAAFLGGNVGIGTASPVTTLQVNGVVTSTGLDFSNKSINTTAGDAATINAPAGRFRKDTSGTTFTLTNSFITVNSIIWLTNASSGANAPRILSVVAAAGSAVITFWSVNGLGTDTIVLAPAINLDVDFGVIN